VPAFANEVIPEMLPRFMLSTALLGTMIVLPRSLIIKHVHAAQVQSNRVIGVGSRRLDEFLSDFCLGRAEDDPRLSLALCLRLAAHRIL
jgi:hypothetical protein